jgi:hypothetical protein
VRKALTDQRSAEYKMAYKEHPHEEYVNTVRPKTKASQSSRELVSQTAHCEKKQLPWREQVCVKTSFVCEEIRHKILFVQKVIHITSLAYMCFWKKNLLTRISW